MQPEASPTVVALGWLPEVPPALSSLAVWCQEADLDSADSEHSLSVKWPSEWAEWDHLVHFDWHGRLRHGHFMILVMNVLVIVEMVCIMTV